MSSLNSLNAAVVTSLITYFIELSCVVVTVINTDLSSINADIDTNAEVWWHEWALRTVLLENHLSLEEGTLRCARVYDLWFCQHDRFVF